MTATWIPAGESQTQRGLHSTIREALSRRGGGDVLPGVVRETIQNALGAKKHHALGPVLVEFKWETLCTDAIPGLESFREILNACKAASRREEVKKISRMEDILRKNLVHVLRISDHNTVGLIGAAEDTDDSNWHRLVREEGTGAQGRGGLGSHGVGKLIPFMASGLHTVFYSSVDETGFRSHIGVSRLCSYRKEYGDESERPYTDGVYYYQNDRDTWRQCGHSSLEGTVPFACPERADGDTGTDLYILGFNVPQRNALRHTILRAVLDDFLFSIQEGALEVDLPPLTGGQTVSPAGNRLTAGTLPVFIEELASARANANVRLVNAMATLAQQSWMEYLPNRDGVLQGFKAGDFKFKFLQMPGVVPQCIVTREAYMALETIRTLGVQGVVGILTLLDSEICEFFRRMENANHTKFIVDEEFFPDEKERERAEGLLESLKSFIQEYVKREYATERRDRVHAAIPPKLRAMFGQRTDLDLEGNPSISFQSRIQKTAPGKKSQSGPLHKGKNVGKGGTGGGGINKPRNPTDPPLPPPKPQPPKNRRVGGTTPDGPEPGFAGVPFPIPPRVVQMGNPEAGRYRFVLTMPETAQVVKVRFQAVGENGRDAAGVLKLAEVTGMIRDGQMDGEGFRINPLQDEKGRSTYTLEIYNPEKGQNIQFDAKFDVDFGVLFNILYSATKRRTQC